MKCLNPTQHVGCIQTTFAWLCFDFPASCTHEGRCPLKPERARNDVLQQLARDEPSVSARLHEDLEPVALERGAVLGPVRLPSEWVYFVESGIVSLVAGTR